MEYNRCNVITLICLFYISFKHTACKEVPWQIKLNASWWIRPCAIYLVLSRWLSCSYGPYIMFSDLSRYEYFAELSLGPGGKVVWAQVIEVMHRYLLAYSCSTVSKLWQLWFDYPCNHNKPGLLVFLSEWGFLRKFLTFP